MNVYKGKAQKETAIPHLATGQHTVTGSPLVGSYPLAGLSPNACPDMVLSYSFQDNLVPHIHQSIVERIEKMCPVLPPNGS